MPHVLVHHHPLARRLSGVSVILSDIVWVVFTLIESLLLIRFIFRLLGANAAAPFTQFLYSLAQPFVAPFLEVFPATRLFVGSWSGVVDWSTLLAILVYYVIALLLLQVFSTGEDIAVTSTKE
ncbi:YggT family protein [Candidatus Uhrbacteria bacterium]|nr:YggT family protein [Candidatus Uhrbacteria bacterium]